MKSEQGLLTAACRNAGKGGKGRRQSENKEKENFHWIKQWVCDVSYTENKVTVYTSKTKIFSSGDLLLFQIAAFFLKSSLFLKK